MPPDSPDDSAPSIAPRDHVIFTDLGGAEGVLVDLESKQYYLLNETACLIWRELANGRPVTAIAAEIIERYDVSLEHAQSSIETAIRGFVAHRLVGPSR